MRKSDKKQPIDHPWDLAPAEAITLQQRLSHLIVRRSNLKKVATIAGVDSGYKNGIVRGAVVVLKYPTLETVAQSFVEQRVNFPYIPGLLPGLSPAGDNPAGRSVGGLCGLKSVLIFC
jgi:hypothetical protein